MSYSRQQVVDTLRRAGFRDVAEKAAAELPDMIELDDLQTWTARHGITRDIIVSQLGGSS